MADVSVDIAGRRVAIRRLTVGDVYDWLAELEHGEETNRDLVSELALEDISLRDLARMADLDLDSLKALDHEQLNMLVEAAKRVNPHFFRVAAPLTAARRNLFHEFAAKNLSNPPRP